MENEIVVTYNDAFVKKKMFYWWGYSTQQR